jgi:hypothetical protein
VRVCIAVGYHAGGTGPFVALAEAWNGSSWRLLAAPTPAGASFAQLVSVSCSAANACTAVGSYARSFGRDLPLAERWNGTRWEIQATPAPAGAAPAHLFGVSCSAANVCTAVGSYVLPGPRNIPFGEAWNGTRWEILPVPSPVGATSADLTGISCRAANACTAVGAYTNGYSALLTLAERWNGTRWRIQVTPRAAAASGLSGVSCSSARACTAAGSLFTGGGRDRALAEAWNGTRWHIQATPNPVGATSSGLSAVSCSSPAACTAVGADLAERWNGARWALQVMPSPGGAVLAGVSCPSRTACVAVGRHQDGISPLTVAEAWNGTSWRIQATPNPAGTFGSVLRGVSCTSASACTAVGSYNRGPFGPAAPLAEAWNGSRWSIQAAPSPVGAADSALGPVSCTSANACTALGGYSTSGHAVMFAERWDGMRWTVQAVPSPNPDTSFAVLSGLSCTSASTCTAVGAYVNSAGTTLAFAERWDGTSWSIQATPSPADAFYSFLRSVSCTSASACTAVGDQGTITSANAPLAERWDGSSWSIQATPSLSVNSTQLYGVSCPSADACTAVGYHRNDAGISFPLAEAWNGTSWSIQTTPNPSGAHGMFLNGVSCSSAEACTAVGTTGDEHLPIVAERWDGTRWGVQTMALPAGAAFANMRAVSCVLANACTAVGEYPGGSDTSLTLAETTF